MKITINGQRFETTKAKETFDLYWLDARSNAHRGTVYLSSAGTWYVYTPSQWSNMHDWRVMSAEEILSEYDRYLKEEHKVRIAEIAGLSWE